MAINRREHPLFLAADSRREYLDDKHLPSPQRLPRAGLRTLEILESLFFNKPITIYYYP